MAFTRILASSRHRPGLAIAVVLTRTLVSPGPQYRMALHALNNRKDQISREFAGTPT